MATTESTSQAQSSGFLAGVVRVVLVVLFTGVETVALVTWLALVLDAAPVSQTAAVGLGVLFVGLVVEHFLTDQAVNGVDLSFPVGAALVFSATEAALWALWLVVAERVGGIEGLVVAGALLAILLVPQHTIEDNALRGAGLLSSLLDLRTLGFSIIEGLGATVWLLFVTQTSVVEPLLTDLGVSTAGPETVGVAILAVALLVEHVVGVSFSRRS